MQMCETVQPTGHVRAFTECVVAHICVPPLYTRSQNYRYIRVQQLRIYLVRVCGSVGMPGCTWFGKSNQQDVVSKHREILAESLSGSANVVK